MDSRIIEVIYITLFLVLSAILYVVIIPSKKEYSDYRKSRRIMATALMLTSILGVLRLLFPSTSGQHYAERCVTLVVSYIFTCLNYISFMYMIETSRPMRKKAKKAAFIFLVPTLALALAGIIIEHHHLPITISLTVLCMLMNTYLFNSSLREYDKFMLQMSNYYDNNLDIRWIPGCLWATFIIALAMSGAMFYEPLYIISGGASIFVFPYISMKLLSFIPANIHVVRRKIAEHEIIAQEPVTIPTVLHETETETETEPEPEPEPEPVQKSAEIPKKLEKVGVMIDRWTSMEHYTQPDINIKDVATEMGTNSNYLSTYINKVLGTSFAIWLNTLRVEKSKEYLCSKTRISIEECGMKVGYQSLYNYSRWFKTVTGMSPSEWRKTQCEI